MLQSSLVRLDAKMSRKPLEITETGFFHMKIAHPIEVKALKVN